MKSIIKPYFVAIAIIAPIFSIAQENKAQEILSKGEIHGNFQTDFQTYNKDSLIGAPIVPEKSRFNGFANVNYINGNFKAGLRYESYQNALLGIDPRFKGEGITYKYVTYAADKFEFTVGNYYEQFGSGLIFRTYEERNLGYDNMMDGVRVKFNPYKGIYIKGIHGKQRLFFAKANGIVRGIDGEIVVNEIHPFFETWKTNITLGASFVSKYEQDNNSTFVLPENVGAHAFRVNINRGKWTFQTEYAFKINDPYSNPTIPAYDYNYRHGEALFASLGYSQKGLGINIEAKRVDNMMFRSQRAETGVNALINYLPATTKFHTYNLAATLYPYAVQPNGEMSVQADVIYTFKKGSLFGGKYGTTISVNFSGVNNIDTIVNLGDTVNRNLYRSNFFDIGKDVYFRDFNIEIQKKISNKLKLNLAYFNFVYNMAVIQGLIGKETVYANIGVIDLAYKLDDTNTLRGELQYLRTKQDQGDWGTALIEYTHPKFFVAVLDQYNMGNKDAAKRIHYVTGSVGYINGGTRFMLSYGRQRAGIFCVGGVCRNVPASNGLTVSITSSF